MSPADSRSWEMVLDQIDIGVLVQDEELRILYANDAAGRLLGRSESEMTGLTAHDETWGVVDVEGNPVPGELHPSGRVRATGEPVRGVLLGVRQPGKVERAWLVVDANRLSPAEDGSMRIVSTFTRIAAADSDRSLAEVAVELEEVAARRTAELLETNARLSEASSRYRAVIRAMAEGVCIMDMDGTIRVANPAAEQILGLTRGQMQGRSIADPDWAMIREDGSPLPYAETPYELTRRTKRPGVDQLIGVHRGAADRAWISVNTDPIRIGDEVVGVVATFTDVTREREMLRRLEESTRRIQTIHDMMPGVVIESFEGDDGTRRVTYASARVEELYGCTPDELTADVNRAWQRIHPEDIERLSRMAEAEMPEGIQEEMEVEFRLRSGDDDWKWVRSTSSVPQRVEGGWIIHSILRDITPEREMARGMREAQRRESMGTLASGIAHNFNNMLAAILPSLERGREEVEGELGQEFDAAFQAASAASELVRRLARLARNEGEVDRRTVDLGEVVDEVVQIARRTFDRRIEVSWSRPEAPIPVASARSELQQVFLNLLLNARDALDGRPDARVDVRISRAGETATVEVADNGTGMSAATQARLGEPFFTTKGLGQGTGLGMATVFGTIRDLQGSLGWESAPEQGTTFRVELPIAADAPGTEVPKPQSPRQELLAGRTVLCVDDEPLVRASLVRMLGRLGAGVVLEGADGDEAMLEVERRPEISLLLVDLSMPGLSGAEVVRRARELRPDLPIVLMSGYLPDQPPAAANAVLSKPFTSRTLGTVLREILP